MKFLTYLFALLALVGLVVISINDRHFQKDIYAWRDLAIIASNPTDMHRYLSKVEEGMQKYQMTSGYSAVIFKTESDNMAEIYKAVSGYAQQAEVLVSLDNDSPEYQVGLINLRDNIQTINLKIDEYWYANHLWFTIGMVISVLGLIATGSWLFACYLS